MSSRPRSDERRVFLDALDLPETERAAFLATACRDNAALQARVLELLAAHAAIGGFLGSPEVTPPAADDRIGTTIGAYRLVERLGEGGFGMVYAAEQTVPLRRRVALKVLKAGVDSTQVVARFEAERQALALMDHPNIARVIDGGATADGRPYFVMELVRGVPITTYCDRHRLAPEQRIELMIDVCNAVQHAHQKGLIHRDLKPANVLVAEHDGRPVPKVIDFGIAKATAGAPSEATAHTDIRQLVGTPAYMSPEQADLNSVDIDTRSDVYALGVLLYELLTGTPPIDPKRLLDAGLGEMQRLIREVEPPRPSTRLNSLGPIGAAIAESRRTEVHRLHRLVHGDLDWIVMRAIDKDRSRRYESTAALAADLRRHLHHEPVDAGPPGLAYRLSKLLRRHRTTTIAAAIVVAALVVGTAAAVVGFAQARIDRNDALAARAEERLAREEADRRRREAEHLAERARIRSDFVTWGLGIGPEVAVAESERSTLSVRQMLDVASATIDRAYAAEPARAAVARQQLGAIYQTLFLAGDAERELLAAMAIFRARRDDRDDVAMLAALRELLDVGVSLDRPDAQLEPLRRERAHLALEILDDRFGAASPETAATLRQVVVALLDGQQLAPSSLRECEEAMFTALGRAALECDSTEADVAFDALALALRSALLRWGDASVAGPLVRLIDWMDEHCPDLAGEDATRLMHRQVVANCCALAGRDEDSLRHLRRFVVDAQRHLPSWHWLFADSASLEGLLLARLGRADEGESRLLEGALQASAAPGPQSLWMSGSLHRLATFTHDTGRTGLLARIESPARPFAASIDRLLLAIKLRSLGDSARELAREIRAAPRGEDDPRPLLLLTLSPMLESAADANGMGRPAECRELLAALIDFPAAPSATIEARRAALLWWLGVFSLQAGELDAAEREIQAALAIRSATLGPDVIWTHNCHRMLGRVRVARGEREAGAAMTLQAFRDMRRVGSATLISVVAAAHDAAEGLVRAGQEAEAAELLATQVSDMLDAEASTDIAPRPVPAPYHLRVALPLALLSGQPADRYVLAERSGRRAAEGLPESGLARLAVGAALARQARYAEALVALSEAEAVDRRGRRPLNATVALFRARCLRALGQLDEADAVAREADRRAAAVGPHSTQMVTWDALRAEPWPERATSPRP